MNLDKIEKLVKIIEESSLQEFSIQEGDIKIKMSKRAGESVAVPFAPHSYAKNHSFLLKVHRLHNLHAIYYDKQM